MAGKRPILSFFRNRKRKINDNIDEISSSPDTFSNNSKETQSDAELSKEASSLETPTVLVSASSISITSSPVASTTASPTSVSSTTCPTPVSPTLISSISIASPSNSSTTASSTPVSPTTISSTSDSSKSKLKCQLVCCTSDGPFVPQSQSDLKISGDKRSCQLGWFLTYKWLSYCKSENKTYCYYCRTAYFGGYHPESNKIGETALTFNGYADWKNALARFAKHESGKIHGDCVYLVKQQLKPTVAARLNLTHQVQQGQRRRMLLTEVECIRYLLRQGLALRGHIEDEGNLIQLLKLRQDDIDGLSVWIKDGNYLSHDIINEICQIIPLSIIRGLLKEVTALILTAVVFRVFST
ncbi:unnamed protein product [Didymodactylos carnosus]|uniref:TTF-type domain-containing protein n=1 Tax=Didymodactylos carnosus TaxID=1234261 RepID=A0A8S2ITF0_9BILA|nr:unnamed protein product [Didymodactylos carnosus]CAF3775324.1 unnamed protein product [Didymodactylos carnosus]